MTPTLPRRSFLGWTAAIAGCALLTRPALAAPTSGLTYKGRNGRWEYVFDLQIPPPGSVIKAGEPRWVGQVFFPFNGAPPTDEEIEAAIAETM